MSKRIFLAVVITIVLVGLIFCLWSAISFYRQARQVRTFVDMNFISRKIDIFTREHDEYTEEDLMKLVRTINDGRDSWGNEFILILDTNAEGLRYLLVSPGSDKDIDIADIAEYFDMQVIDVQEDYEQDIVFLDGNPLTLAGK